MTRPADLQKLAALSQLLLDQRLVELRETADRLQRSREQLASINASAEPADLSPIAAGLVDVAYRRWADIRRAELNTVVARQSVQWMEARAEAGVAIGRVQALRGAMDRLGRKG
jgi:hypothetical protein